VVTMKVVYIFRSEPDETTKNLAEVLAKDCEVFEFKLYEDVDYQELAKKILESDKVICWW